MSGKVESFGGKITYTVPILYHKDYIFASRFEKKVTREEVESEWHYQRTRYLP